MSEDATPTVPLWFELVDLARIDLRPGDFLVAKPSGALGSLWPEQYDELLRWLTEQFPEARIVVIPIAVDLGVIAVP